VELLITSKEFRITCSTAIYAFGLGIGVFTGEGSLRSTMAQDFECQRVELIPQDRIIELDLERFAIRSNGWEW